MKNLAYRLFLSLCACSLSIITSAQGDNPFEPTITSIGKHQVVNCTSAPSLLGVSISPSHPGYSFTWSTGQTDSVISVSPTQSSDYSLHITNSELGINETKHFSVEVQNKPITAQENLYQIAKTVCKGSELEIEPVFTGGHAPFEILWEDNSGERTKTIAPFFSADYLVTITDVCGTVAIAKIEVTLEDHDPIIVPEKNINFFTCDQEIVTLEPSLENISGGVGYGYDFTFSNWDNAGAAKEVAATPDAVYEVAISDECKDQIVFTTVELKQSKLELPEATPSVICEGDLVTLTESTELGRLYYWNGKDMSAEYEEQVYRSDVYDLVYIDECGDDHRIEKSVTVSNVDVSFDYDVHANLNQVNLTAHGSAGNVYTWLLNGKEYSNKDELTAEMEQGTTQEVTLIATNELGCKRGVTEMIHVKDNISIPNAFSPNGDGHNDFFFIASEENFTYFSIEIFDRWGQRIFHSSDQYFKWGGDRSISGELNTYVYILKGKTISGGTVDETGTLTVMN